MTTQRINFAAAVAEAASCVAKPHTADQKGPVTLATQWQYVSGSAIWTMEEEELLEKARVKHKDHVRLDRYILIASELNSKTVRDVAHKLSLNESRTSSSDVSTRVTMSSVRTKSMSLAALSASQGIVMPPYILSLLNTNNAIVTQMQSNLRNGDLHKNRTLSKHFVENTDKIMTAIEGLGANMPPIPLSLNHGILKSIGSESSMSS